ncbi:MAG: thiamine-phosphate kinase [Candidatus Kariarchaeaceae archaeon]|jgi:thiamine-monophosphate kinase
MMYEGNIISRPHSERHLIESIKKYVDQDNRNLLSYDEDAIAIPFGDSILVLNIDGWVASTDRPGQLSWYDSGYRAVINAASDVIAKGALPQGLVASLSLPTDQTNNTVEIVSGIAAAARDYHINYLGGDLNSSEDVVLDVTVWGECKRDLIRRDGARPGEILYWLGPPLGSTATALGVLTSDWEAPQSIIDTSLLIMGKPQLFQEFVDLPATSAIDCSDGLARSLHLLSKASKVGFALDPIQVTESWITKVAALNHLELYDLIMFGGEELGILFTSNIQENLPKSVIQLGVVTKERNITIDGSEIANKGWEHFSN